METGMGWCFRTLSSACCGRCVAARFGALAHHSPVLESGTYGLDYPSHLANNKRDFQFAFFEVQPGHSFHSVEEVVVGTPEDGIQRLSISGW